MNRTPAPWTYDKSSEEVIKPNVVFTGDIGGIKNEADGRLIAAAPELLHCLRVIIEHAEDMDLDDALHLDEARDAVFKATGEKQ